MLGGLSEVLNPVGARRRRRGWWHEAARLRGLALDEGLAAVFVFALAAIVASVGFSNLGSLVRAPLFLLVLAGILVAADARLARVHRRHDVGPD